jgi:hypothetical protein
MSRTGSRIACQKAVNRLAMGGVKPRKTIGGWFETNGPPPHRHKPLRTCLFYWPRAAFERRWSAVSNSRSPIRRLASR